MPPREPHHLDYEGHVSTTESERRAIAAAKVATTDALNELLQTLGIARGNAESVDRFREDLLFLRQLRQRREIWQDLDFLAAMRSGSVKAAARVGLTILTLLTGALAYGIVQWLRTSLGQAPH